MVNLTFYSLQQGSCAFRNLFRLSTLQTFHFLRNTYGSRSSFDTDLSSIHSPIEIFVPDLLIEPYMDRFLHISASFYQLTALFQFLQHSF